MRPTPRCRLDEGICSETAGQNASAGPGVRHSGERRERARSVSSCHIVSILLFWRGILAWRRVRTHAGISVQPEPPRTHKKHRTLSANLALIGRLGCSQRVQNLPSGHYSPRIRHEMHPFWVYSSPVCGLLPKAGASSGNVLFYRRFASGSLFSAVRGRGRLVEKVGAKLIGRRSAHRCIACTHLLGQPCP
jgi:hypothetical protein